MRITCLAPQKALSRHVGIRLSPVPSMSDETSDLPAPARARFRAGARVSVVIPCYNQGEYILDAVASVEAAAGERHELIIVDAGSDDQTTPPILRYLEPRGHHVIHHA